MKQTAVEWLEEQIEYISIQVFDGFLSFTEFMEAREQFFKKAKEIEKQQIINAYRISTIESSVPKEFKKYNLAKQYYNETFKKE